MSKSSHTNGPSIARSERPCNLTSFLSSPFLLLLLLLLLLLQVFPGRHSPSFALCLSLSHESPEVGRNLSIVPPESVLIGRLHSVPLLRRKAPSRKLLPPLLAPKPGGRFFLASRGGSEDRESHLDLQFKQNIVLFEESLPPKGTLTLPHEGKLTKTVSLKELLKPHSTSSGKGLMEKAEGATDVTGRNGEIGRRGKGRKEGHNVIKCSAFGDCNGPSGSRSADGTNGRRLLYKRRKKKRDLALNSDLRNRRGKSKSHEYRKEERSNYAISQIFDNIRSAPARPKDSISPRNEQLPLKKEDGRVGLSVDELQRRKSRRSNEVSRGLMGPAGMIKHVHFLRAAGKWHLAFIQNPSRKCLVSILEKRSERRRRRRRRRWWWWWRSSSSRRSSSSSMPEGRLIMQGQGRPHSDGSHQDLPLTGGIGMASSSEFSELPISLSPSISSLKRSLSLSSPPLVKSSSSSSLSSSASPLSSSLSSVLSISSLQNLTATVFPLSPLPSLPLVTPPPSPSFSGLDKDITNEKQLSSPVMDWEKSSFDPSPARFRDRHLSTSADSSRQRETRRNRIKGGLMTSGLKTYARSKSMEYFYLYPSGTKFSKGYLLPESMMNSRCTNVGLNCTRINAFKKQVLTGNSHSLENVKTYERILELKSLDSQPRRQILTGNSHSLENVKNYERILELKGLDSQPRRQILTGNSHSLEDIKNYKRIAEIESFDSQPRRDDKRKGSSSITKYNKENTTVSNLIDFHGAKTNNRVYVKRGTKWYSLQALDFRRRKVEEQILSKINKDKDDEYGKELRKLLYGLQRQSIFCFLQTRMKWICIHLEDIQNGTHLEFPVIDSITRNKRDLNAKEHLEMFVSDAIPLIKRNVFLLEEITKTTSIDSSKPHHSFLTKGYFIPLDELFFTRNSFTPNKRRSERSAARHDLEFSRSNHINDVRSLPKEGHDVIPVKKAALVILHPKWEEAKRAQAQIESFQEDLDATERSSELKKIRTIEAGNLAGTVDKPGRTLLSWRGFSSAITPEVYSHPPVPGRDQLDNSWKESITPGSNLQRRERTSLGPPMQRFAQHPGGYSYGSGLRRSPRVRNTYIKEETVSASSGRTELNIKIKQMDGSRVYKVILSMCDRLYSCLKNRPSKDLTHEMATLVDVRWSPLLSRHLLFNYSHSQLSKLDFKNSDDIDGQEAKKISEMVMGKRKMGDLNGSKIAIIPLLKKTNLLSYSTVKSEEIEQPPRKLPEEAESISLDPRKKSFQNNFLKSTAARKTPRSKRSVGDGGEVMRNTGKPFSKVRRQRNARRLSHGVRPLKRRRRRGVRRFSGNSKEALNATKAKFQLIKSRGYKAKNNEVELLDANNSFNHDSTFSQSSNISTDDPSYSLYSQSFSSVTSSSSSSYDLVSSTFLSHPVISPPSQRDIQSNWENVKERIKETADTKSGTPECSDRSGCFHLSQNVTLVKLKTSEDVLNLSNNLGKLPKGGGGFSQERYSSGNVNASENIPLFNWRLNSPDFEESKYISREKEIDDVFTLSLTHPIVKEQEETDVKRERQDQPTIKINERMLENNKQEKDSHVSGRPMETVDYALSSKESLSGNKVSSPDSEEIEGNLTSAISSDFIHDPQTSFGDYIASQEYKYDSSSTPVSHGRSEKIFKKDGFWVNKQKQSLVIVPSDGFQAEDPAGGELKKAGWKERGKEIGFQYVDTKESDTITSPPLFSLTTPFSQSSSSVSPSSFPLSFSSSISFEARGRMSSSHPHPSKEIHPRHERERFWDFVKYNDTILEVSRQAGKLKAPQAKQTKPRASHNVKHPLRYPKPFLRVSPRFQRYHQMHSTDHSYSPIGVKDAIRGESFYRLHYQGGAVNRQPEVFSHVADPRSQKKYLQGRRRVAGTPLDFSDDHMVYQKSPREMARHRSDKNSLHSKNIKRHFVTSSGALSGEKKTSFANEPSPQLLHHHGKVNRSVRRSPMKKLEKPVRDDRGMSFRDDSNPEAEYSLNRLGDREDSPIWDTLGGEFPPNPEGRVAGQQTEASKPQAKAKTEQLVPILGLFDLTARPEQHMGGASELAAARLALKHINEKGVLPGHRLVMFHNDTQCDSGIGVDAFFHAIYTLSARIVILLGAACPEVTESLAAVVPYWNIVQLMEVSISGHPSTRSANHRRHPMHSAVRREVNSAWVSKITKPSRSHGNDLQQCNEGHHQSGNATEKPTMSWILGRLEKLRKKTVKTEDHQPLLQKQLEQQQQQEPSHRPSEFNLTSFDYSRDDMADKILETMQRLRFRGVSGPISFDCPDRVGVTAFYQIQDGKPRIVALYHPEEAAFDLLCPGCHVVVWPGGEVPTSRVFKIWVETISPAAFFIMSALASLGILMALAFLIFNLTYRRLKYIKLSSPRLNNTTVVGCILVYMAVILLGFDHATLPLPHYFPVICTARAYLLSAGFSLAFGSMFTKTYRVHQIFTRSNSAGVIRNKLLKDKQLITLIMVLLAVDVMIVSAWVGVDPMRRHLHNLTLERSTEERGVVYQPQVEVCRSARTSELWLGAFYVYKGLLVAVGVYMAWETRHVKIPALNDSQYIGMSVYNVVITSAIVIVAANIISERTTLAYVIVTTLIITPTTTTLCLLFIPKILTIWKKAEGDPIVESMELKIQSNTRRLMTEDKREKFYRAEIQNKVYRRELLKLEQEILKLKRKMESPDSPTSSTESFLILNKDSMISGTSQSSNAKEGANGVIDGKDAPNQGERGTGDELINEDFITGNIVAGRSLEEVLDASHTQFLRSDDATVRRVKRERMIRSLHRSLPSLTLGCPSRRPSGTRLPADGAEDANCNGSFGPSQVFFDARHFHEDQEEARRRA
ncbi:uncharacterized protein [Palaemon carinicauda]|uniref:uncharacterized protein n=1 Tax=Palaemon carinicauda TaxID=392227 RepID=UPI0035B69D2E